MEKWLRRLIYDGASNKLAVPLLVNNITMAMGRGEGVIVEEDASRDIFGGGLAPSQPTTPVWGTDESLGRWGRNESKVKIARGDHTISTEVYGGHSVQQSILRGPYEAPTRLQSVKRGSYEKSARGMLYEQIYTEEENVENYVRRLSGLSTTKPVGRIFCLSTHEPVGDLSTACTNPTTEDLLGTMHVQVQVENMGYNHYKVGD